VRAAQRCFRVAVGARRRTGQFVPEAGIFVFEFPNPSAEILVRWW